MVRAKFKCESVGKVVNWNKTEGKPFLYSVVMTPVYANNDPEHENSKFWAASPSGRFEMQSILPDAFEPGKEYYIDISEAK